ncbi:hypothetical protein TNCV_1267981 [Trichonephila clavipes]|nr:hypothetical protein TNCV_1267981 [Trichonephila clavipes]
MSAKGLIEALRQSICLGMIRRCETMINVTSRRERNKSGSKDGSTICDNYSRSSTPEDNFFKCLGMTGNHNFPSGSKFFLQRIPVDESEFFVFG